MRERPPGVRRPRLPDWARWNVAAAERAWTVGIEDEAVLLDLRSPSVANRIDDVLAALPAAVSAPAAARHRRGPDHGRPVGGARRWSAGGRRAVPRRRHAGGEHGRDVGPEVLGENRFLAARDGMRAELIDERAQLTRPLRDVSSELLEDLGPLADGLGCRPELAAAAALEGDPGDARQRRHAAQHGLPELANRLADEYAPADRAGRLNAAGPAALSRAGRAAWA
jgi:hypothetical protein